MNKKIWVISEAEKKIIRSLLLKGRKEQVEKIDFAIIEFDAFYKLFTDEEADILKKFLSINPKEIGYKLPFLGFESPIDLISIPNQTFIKDGEMEIIPCPYLPKKTFEAYARLNSAIQNDINKKLLVNHGYRSPARQVFLFFDILERVFNFDFDKTIQRVCFPDYSEHVCSKMQAIDFMTETGIKSDRFDATEEYQWLQNNAQRFGFYESYPKGNALDMMYEAWHWHHENLEYET